MGQRELTEHEVRLLLDYIEAVSVRDNFEELRVKARDQLAASLGEDKGLYRGKPAVTVNRSTPSLFDTAKFKAEHELLYDQYVHPTQERASLYVHKGVLDSTVVSS